MLERQEYIKSLVDQGLTSDEIKIKLVEFDNQKKVNKASEPDFQTPTTQGAVVEETIAPDMELVSEDISSELLNANKTIKENATKTEQGYWSEFANVFKNQFGIGVEGKGLSGEMGDVRRYSRYAEAIDRQLEKANSLIEKNEFVDSKQFRFLRMRAANDGVRIKTAEDGINFLKNKRKEHSNEIFESLVGSQKFQNEIAKIGSPEVFDEDGLTWNDTKRILGTQSAQMLTALVSFGGSTFAQESTGVAMDLLTKAAIEKNSLAEGDWSKLSNAQRAEYMYDIIDAGEAADIFKKAEVTGALNAGLDLVGNFFVIGKATKLAPKGALRNLIKGKVQKELKQYGKQQAIGQAVEVGTELTQETISGIAKDELPDAKEYAEVFAQTLIGGGGIQVGVAGTTNVAREATKEAVALYDTESLRRFANEARQKIKIDGRLNEETRNERLNLIDKAEMLADEKYSNVDGQRRKIVFDLLVDNEKENKKLQNLQSRKETLQKQNRNIENINVEIEKQQEIINNNEISAEKEVTTSNHIKNGHNVIEWMNAQTKGVYGDKNGISFKTREQAKKYIEKNNIPITKLDDKGNEVPNNVGLMLEGDVDGVKLGNTLFVIDQNIFENTAKGSDTSINTFHHEAVHMIFDGAVEGNPKILSDLRKKIESKIKNDKILNTTISKALSTRVGKYNLESQDQEFFAALSDIFRVQKETISQQTGVLFEMGQDFQKAFAKELKGKIDIGQFDAENTLKFISKFNEFKGIPSIATKLKALVGKAPKLKATDVQDDLASIPEQASNRVQELYNEKGFENAFEIIEQFNPIINKLVDKRREAPGFNKEELTSAIKYEDRGILGLIRSYKPDSKVPLAAYINKFLPSRMIEASNAILGEEFTLDVTEAKGVVSQEIETIIDAPPKKLIDLPKRIFNNEQLNKAKKLIKADKRNPSELSLATLGNITAPITAEIFDVPAKKFLDPKSNLTKQEVINGRQAIIKNAKLILDTRTDGAIDQDAAVSARLQGTSTKLPKSILNTPLYIKGERLTKGAGITPYNINPAATVQDVINSVGEAGAPAIPRSPEAQRIKAYIKDFDSKVTNVLYRQEKELTPQQVADIEAGKNDALASKADFDLAESLGIEMYDYNTVEGTKKYIEDLKQIIPYFPDGFLNRTILVNGKHTKRQIVRNELKKIKKLNLRDKQYGKTKFNGKLVTTKTSEQLRVLNKRNVENFVLGWNITNKIIQERPDLVPTLLHMFRVSQNEGSHWHRLGAEYVGIKKGLVDPKGVYLEHALPNAGAYRLLIESSVKNEKPFNEVLEAVQKNYKLIAVTKQDNAQIDAEGLKNAMDLDGTWNVFDNNWWDRYVNAKLNLNEYLTLDGETFTDALINTDLASKPQNLSKEFNAIIEQKTGIEAFKKFGKVKGKTRGKQKGLMNFFIPYSAEDFQGLMYAILPKGKDGDAAMEWMRQTLFRPYSQAMENISKERAAIMNDFTQLKKNLSNVPKALKKKIKEGSDFTNQDAIRVFVWDRQGMNIPGLSAKDKTELINVVKNNKDFSEFASSLININKAEGYIKPDDNWIAGTITTDLLENLNTVKRKKHLKQWKENVDAVFTEENKNKLRAAYGDSYIQSLENILRRMESGRNRTGAGDTQIDNWLDWLNNSVGAIMFLNVRSATLQTISTVNYMNWSDNNPLKAAKAFANQKQFWSDFAFIFNSAYLKERRGDLQLNVSENEIADAAQKGGVKGAISYLLNKGFVLTRAADSFAIANGGASFYRNRVNSYIKQGLTEEQAKSKAFIDFKELTEEAQQSSRPDRISKEQASGFGRVILAFANTPMQYTRLMKRAAQDLIAGRGDAKTNISKLVYYGAVQNFIFNALQQALFALGFDGEEEKEKRKEKYQSILNSMLDSILRGTGVVGNAVMVGKNFAMDIAKRSNKPKPNFQDSAWRLLDISPPLDSKVTKVRSALYTLEYEGDKMIEEGISLDNPAAMASAQTISAFTNVPLDRVMRIYDNTRAAVASDTEAWQRVALLLGWSTWELDIEKKSTRVRPRKTYDINIERSTGVNRDDSRIIRE